jgi:hypothetical protein
MVSAGVHCVDQEYSMPPLRSVMKYTVAVLAAALWALGLADQFYSWEMLARYMALSAAMVAVATL